MESIVPFVRAISVRQLSLAVLSNNIFWKCYCHIDFIIKKAKKHLYGLSQLKRSGLGHSELVQFFCTCIRPIKEYAWTLFHDGLFMYHSNELECVQKEATYAHYFSFLLIQWGLGSIGPNQTFRQPFLRRTGFVIVLLPSIQFRLERF